MDGQMMPTNPTFALVGCSGDCRILFTSPKKPVYRFIASAGVLFHPCENTNRSVTPLAVSSDDSVATLGSPCTVPSASKESFQNGYPYSCSLMRVREGV